MDDDLDNSKNPFKSTRLRLGLLALAWAALWQGLRLAGVEVEEPSLLAGIGAILSLIGVDTIAPLGDHAGRGGFMGAVRVVMDSLLPLLQAPPGPPAPRTRGPAGPTRTWPPEGE